MKEGDFVYIDYVGKISDTGEIFDLTSEDIAKKEGIYNPGIKYKPIPVVIGGNFVIKGLDEALREMSVGEKKTIIIPIDKAFGERKGEMIKLIPQSTFKEQNINPNPGSYVTINGLNGRVISNDGGRVRVDFNHPLAGKKLEYELELKSEIKEASDKVIALVSYFTGFEKENMEVSISEKIADVKLIKTEDMPSRVKDAIAKSVGKWVGMDKVRFVYEFDAK